MSWIPIFTVGVGNAWILMLFVLLHPLVMNLVDKTIGTGRLSQKMGYMPTEDGMKKPLPIPTLCLYVLFIISIFVPLKLGSVWLFVGLGIYIVGLATFLSSLIVAAKTPFGTVFSQGMYRYSRHPIYLSFLMIFFGVGVATLSWVLLLLSMLWMAFPLSQVAAEEKDCLSLFGTPYREYMDRTPKWLGMPRSNQPS